MAGGGGRRIAEKEYKNVVITLGGRGLGKVSIEIGMDVEEVVAIVHIIFRALRTSLSISAYQCISWCDKFLNVPFCVKKFIKGHCFLCFRALILSLYHE